MWSRAIGPLLVDSGECAGAWPPCGTLLLCVPPATVDVCAGRPARNGIPDRPERGRLIRGEAVKQTRAASANEGILAASATRVRRIPGSVVTALFVRMPELRGPVAVARPITASVIHAIGVGSTVWLRSGENVVLIR